MKSDYSTDVLKKIVLLCIRLYQKTLSFDTGIVSWFTPVKFCRFHPTCSNYTYEAVVSFGIMRGGWMGLKRILKCHPWNPGGYDPVIKPNQEGKEDVQKSI